MPKRERLVRRVVAALIVAAGGYGVYQFSYLPYASIVFQRRAEETLLRAAGAGASIGRARMARNLAEQSLEWIERCPTQVNLYMIAAASLRLNGRSEDAIALYNRALKFDRRPELYLNLGLAQIEAGDTPTAVETLATAVQFDPGLMDQVPEPERDHVDQVLRSRRL